MLRKGDRDYQYTRYVNKEAIMEEELLALDKYHLTPTGLEMECPVEPFLNS